MSLDIRILIEADIHQYVQIKTIKRQLSQTPCETRLSKQQKAL
jgi:hypothetical protein